jgi:hypothetical protein
MEREIKKYIKHWKGIMIFICALLAVYVTISIYFFNHFYFGSVINCIDVSGKTVEGAEKEILNEINGYSLELEGRDNIKEQMKGTDINLKYNLGSKIQELKKNQNPFAWIFALIKKKDYKISEVVEYNEDLLKVRFNNLSYFDPGNIIEPKNPNIKYTDNGYVIENEVYGNKIKKDTLYEHLVNAIVNGEKKINLQSSDCYENPQYSSNSTEVINAKNILNKYTAPTITYKFGNETEEIDGSMIQDWLTINDDFTITFDKQKISDYVKKLAKTYDTTGKIREFATSLRTTIKVSGGDYGWSIDINKNVQDLIELIKKGESITKEPIYKQTAISHDDNDIGNTYVEINLTTQHLWYYKNGFLIIEGDVVTGNVSKGNSTPVGIYTLKFKVKNAILKGEGYTTPVDFWMPFNGGVGIHDAKWRGTFGGDVYKTNGSHGCVNAPYYLANIIFNNIEEGTPVVCYS